MEDINEASTNWSLESRDLLIELRTQLKSLIQEVKDLKAGVTVSGTDHEVRLRVVEKNMVRTQTFGAIGVVLLGILQFALNYFKK